MKLYIQTTPNGSFETIDVKDDPLGKGGQGAVYNIITSQYKDDYCIKIYLRDAQKAYEKIKYMVTHPPKNIKDNPSFRICWPVALVYDTSKKFVGYMMPLAFPKGHDLTILSVYKSKPLSQIKRYKKYTEWHNKYELDTTEGIKNRIMMLKNVAVALHRIHETGRYVLVDLKPENIDATGTGKVSIMDTDSIQISEGGRILHPATAFTPDYFAPEGKELQKCKRPFSLQCDYFAAAICFYQILTGTHPYSGTVLKHPYDKCTELSDCIANGLFAYGEKSRYISFPQGFNLQQNFFNLPAEVQALFKRAFGSSSANRPSMEEWGRVFHSIVTQGITVKGSSVKRAPAATNAFEITAIAFNDQDNDGKVIRAVGNKLYTDVTYLCPILTYTVHNPAGKVTLRYRIISPNGNELTNANATGTLDISVKGGHKEELGGWGNDKKTLYKVAGEYKIEIYHLNKCIYKSSFTIHPLGSQGRTTPTPAPPKPAPTPTPTNSVPLKITSVSFVSTDPSAKIVTPSGNYIYNDIQYLNAKISGVASSSLSCNLHIRITDPSGKVKTNLKSSPKAGFYQSNFRCAAGQFSYVLTGWGNDNGTSYSTTGRYKYEIFYNDTCLYTTYVTIYEKSGRHHTSSSTSTHRKSRSGENLWQTLNNKVANIGYWIEDHIDTVGDDSVWTKIFAVIGGLGLIAGAIGTGSIIWGIVVLVLGYAIGIYVVTIGGVVFGWIGSILANVARYIFYNIYTLLATIAVIVATSFGPAIVDSISNIGKKEYTAKSVTTSKQTTTYVCRSKDVLNIRKQANATSEVIGTIRPGSTIEVYSISKGWAKVKYNSQTAYAKAEYLELKE